VKPSGGIVLRGMTLDDVPAVAAIDRRSFPLPWSENSFRSDLSSNPAAHLLVAEHAGNGEGAGDVDARDGGVGDGTAHERGVHDAGDGEVLQVLRAAGDLGQGVLPVDGAPDFAQIHARVNPGSP